MESDEPKEEAPKRAWQIEKAKLIVVEGKDDKVFFEAMLEHLMSKNEIQVAMINGKSSYEKKLQGLVNSPDFQRIKSLGLVRDADDNAVCAFESMRNAVERIEFPNPEDKPHISFFVLPDAVSRGKLETMLLRAADIDPAMKCVNEYFGCLKKCGASLPSDEEKAKIQVFIASRPKVPEHLGLAAHQGCWQWNNAVFEPLKDFISLLLH